MPFSSFIYIFFPFGFNRNRISPDWTSTGITVVSELIWNYPLGRHPVGPSWARSKSNDTFKARQLFPTRNSHKILLFNHLIWFCESSFNFFFFFFKVIWRVFLYHRITYTTGPVNDRPASPAAVSWMDQRQLQCRRSINASVKLFHHEINIISSTIEKRLKWLGKDNHLVTNRQQQRCNFLLFHNRHVSRIYKGILSN